ncbi:MAG: SdiA-regulated domain-containing protein [Bacteroidales bacterium]|nr:SdiA-regulated domain-containing protein [Bacteroidales bacterium]
MALILVLSFCNSSTVINKDELPSDKQSNAISEASGTDSSDNKSDILIQKPFNGTFPYDLNKPDEKYTLPQSLQEISGIVYYQNNKILCIQDEQAKIYTYDLGEKDIVTEYDFGKNDDFEDIALVDQTVYVIRSDGRIYEIKDFDTNERDVEDYKTPLSKKNDTEGLSYDANSNALLIACKDSPAIDKESPYEGHKAIYKFDLREMELIEEPYILVDLAKIVISKQSGFKKFSLRIARALRLIESENVFHPSGIALHPHHDEIYVISSIGKILIVFDRKGKILDSQDLDPAVFRQPEGICFSPSGDLYIASEGQGGKGYILRFSQQQDR